MGVISGGVQVNFVPDEAVIEIDRRLLPGEEVETVLAHYQSLLDELAKRHPNVIAEMEKPMLQDWYIKRWKYRSRGITTAAYVETVTGFIDRAIARQN